MRNTARPIAILAVVSMFVLAVAVFAQVAGPPRGTGPAGPPTGERPVMTQRGPVCPLMTFAPRPPEWVDLVAADLGLTEDQKTKGKAMMKALAERLQAIDEQSKPLPDLITAMRANPTDAAKVKSLATDCMKKEEAMLQAQLQAWMEFEKLLTAEQQTKLWDSLLRRGTFMSPAGGPPAGGAAGGRQRPPAPPQ